MFIVACRGEEVSRDEQLIFEECAFGGFILFRENCRAPGQISALCRTLWQTAPDTSPFLAIDQEGGRVQRLRAPFTHFPASLRIGSRRDAELAYRCGRAVAAELVLIGINLNLAPMLDVASNPANPIVGDRAFGRNPRQVIHLGLAWMRGLREGGIVPCGKHFPGHGDTDQDSHLTLPAVDKPLDELKAVELPPFIEACRHQVEALMTAHVRYRALDPKLPATLSEPIVTGLLRHQLGYDGLIFSDDIAMKAISDHFPPTEAAVLAIRAGIDVLLFCHELSQAVEALEFVSDEAERDPALRAQIENSFRRISAAKHRCLGPFTGLDEREIIARLNAMNHQRLVDEIYGSL